MSDMALHAISPNKRSLPSLPQDRAAKRIRADGIDPTALDPKFAWVSLQRVLKERAEQKETRDLIFYSSKDLSNVKRVSYSDLYAQAKQNSIIVRSLKNFEEGQPILLHLDDQWSSILWFWSILLANGLPVISSPFSNVDEHRCKHIQRLSTLLESPICLTKDELLPLFHGEHTLQLCTIESLKKKVPLQQDLSGTRSRSYDGEQLPAVLMLTSGSTGGAKAVCLTHKQVLAAVDGKSSVRSLPADRPFLNWIGLDHVASLVEIHIQALWLGVDQIHINAADIVSSPKTFLDLLSRHGVSRSFAPNFFLARLVAAIDSGPEDPAWDLRNLTVLASGGEANDVATCVAASALLEKYGARRNTITTGFGMTETCAGAIFNLECPDFDVKNGRSVASLGKCMKGIEMRVTVATHDSSTKLALTDEPGDLEVRGSVVFQSYYRNPKATAEAFTPDGWFRTRDQAKIDFAGNLHLIGRVHDVVNINGVKLASSDIQASIEQVLTVRVANVITFPTRAAHTEQVTVAYIPKKWPLKPADMADIEDLAAQACIVSTGSRPFVFPLSERSILMLPKSALGKISRPKMRLLFQEGVFAEDVSLHRQAVEAFRQEVKTKSRETTANEAEAKLIEDFATTLDVPPDAVSLDTSAFDLGSTSMDLIRLKHRIDNRLMTTVPIIKLMKHPTPRSLAAALDPELSRGPANVEQSITAEYDPVVTLRSTGTKTPLWLVHPGVGEVLVFFGLAQHLSDDNRPIYALRARGFEAGQERFADIRETVDTYAKAITDKQPHGPYALAGYSYGTMLAFELAKKLNADRGESAVRFLGSFNLPPHIKTRMQHLNWNMCVLHLAWFLDLITEAYTNSVEESSFRAMQRADALAQILGVSNRARMEELGLGDEGIARWTDVAYGLQSMAIDYEPGGEVDGIDVFHAIPLKVAAASREEWVEDHLSKWSDFCRSKPIFHEVDGAHYTMIGPEHVLGFSEKLKGALRDRGL